MIKKRKGGGEDTKDTSKQVHQEVTMATRDVGWNLCVSIVPAERF